MRVVLISLDAAFSEDFDFLRSLPAVGRMIREGTSCARMETVYPALTYPVHVSMVTGKNPGEHGIGHNQPFGPGVPEDKRPWYWDAREIRAPTLFDAARRAGLRTAAILWPVSGKNPSIQRNFPEVLALPGESQALKMLRYGTAWWILSMELRYGRSRPSVREPYLSDYAALLAQKLLLSRRPPDFLAVHLVDLDAARHRFGTNSSQARDALIRLDERVAGIQGAAERAGLSGDTVFCVVSDHGQADVARTVLLEDKIRELSGPEVKVQSLGMGAYIYPIHAENRGETEAFLKRHMDAVGARRVYDRAELNRLGAVKNVPLAVEAAEGVAYADHLEKGKAEKATHGFAPDHPAAKCLFILSGPGVPPGRTLEEMKVTQIAPVLADVMGVSFQDVENKC